LASKTELKRFRSNLADELDSAALYETLATVEQDGSRKAIYAELAASERKHAQVWQEKLRANGVKVRAHQYSAKTHVMRALVRVFGPNFVLRTVAATEYADRDKYAGQPDAAQMAEEEHRHADMVQRVANQQRPAAIGAVAPAKGAPAPGSTPKPATNPAALPPAPTTSHGQAQSTPDQKPSSAPAHDTPGTLQQAH